MQWLSVTSGAVAAGCGSHMGTGPSADASTRDAHKPMSDGQGTACKATSSDVQGPFFEAGAPQRAKIAEDNEPGQRLMLKGVVEDSDCIPIAGALLDVWQADKDGVYHGAAQEYRLRGQIITDAQGAYTIDTIKPGSYTLAPNSWRPAHIHFTVSKPGYASLTTQLYFTGDPFLPPNDGCGATCKSDDPLRIIELTSSASGLQGSFRIVLART